jgi:predicted Rossmann fold nucleotide-binding protein DprA/Smf involved in DNA uptake
MQWIGISGSWRKINEQIESDVRKEVGKIIANNKGIVSGGALGVDYIATDEALKLNPSATQIKIFLPTTLNIYITHYRKRATEGVITSAQAEMLISQLEKLARLNKEAIIEDKRNKVVNTETYYQRNMEVIKASNELLAFHVNRSAGTQDAINKAKQRGIPVKIFEYTLT